MSTVTMQSKSPTETLRGVRFHLSLNVADLGRSVEFFRIFLGVDPAKRRDDYAKFELDDPPLVLSLEPIAPRSGGALNHLGFRVPDAATLVETQRRLESRGISTQREEGVECCYARQTKFWVQDPDGNLWEVYTLDEDIETRGMGPLVISRPAETPAPASDAPAPAIWSHRLGQPLPTRLFVQPESVDEARLQGTFNAACTADQRRKLLAEVFIALKPGGRLILHQLTADREAPLGRNQLPGPAAMVEAAPPIADIVREVEAAGFVGIRFERLGDHPCFTVNGAEMRETILVAEKPQAPAAPHAAKRRVLYKGPFAQITLDGGLTLRRGEFVLVDENVYHALQTTASGQFVFAGEP